jgi:hypothetical protein
MLNPVTRTHKNCSGCGLFLTLDKFHNIFFLEAFSAFIFSISERGNNMGLFSKKGFFLTGCSLPFAIQLYRVWWLMPNSFLTSAYLTFLRFPLAYLTFYSALCITCTHYTRLTLFSKCYIMLICLIWFTALILEQVGEAAADFYITAMKMGIKLPAWNTYDTGDGNWLPGYEEHEKPSKKGRAK